ncbi:MAG: peptide chain release factor N(5)-glutamine methyltransferase [Candidatus Kaiserbacteria bacterium]|nr:peptide chain release factor N(5)-glutamine methyltransferase [Candidatus Kaiserbacteria bacterium]MCB9816204.1 peptide chain release factor N(5)-glutamine methyltransferase [Candidatus Nomurabacteria bacterium]
MDSQERQWLLAEKYNGEKSKAFFADVKRLFLGEPLAYLIGHVPFLGNTIYLDSRPLIPRPETEYWTEEAINTIRGGATLPLGFESKPVKVLDLCAGSGCVGVSVAKELPNTLVDFAELDRAHLPTIEKNLKENQVSKDRYHIYHSSLFSTVPDTYDFILSNPPYIDPTLDRTEPSVKQYEPYHALYGGEKGLEIIIMIITEAPKHLRRGGQLWIEHEPEQSQAIKDLAEKHGFNCTTHKDQFGTERYSILVLQ